MLRGPIFKHMGQSYHSIGLNTKLMVIGKHLQFAMFEITSGEFVIIVLIVVVVVKFFVCNDLFCPMGHSFACYVV